MGLDAVGYLIHPVEEIEDQVDDEGDSLFFCCFFFLWSYFREDFFSHQFFDERLIIFSKHLVLGGPFEKLVQVFQRINILRLDHFCQPCLLICYQLLTFAGYQNLFDRVDDELAHSAVGIKKFGSFFFL